MVNQEKISGTGQAAAATRNDQRPDDEISPPDKIRGESAAHRQKGQPGLPDSNEEEWSPGSDAEK